MKKLRRILAGIISMAIVGSCSMIATAESYLEDPFWSKNPTPSKPSETISYYADESNVVWTSDDLKFKGYANGEIMSYSPSACDYLIVADSDIEITNASLNIDDNYSIKDVTNDTIADLIENRTSLDGKKVYLISDVNSSDISEELKQNMISEKIDASFEYSTCVFEPRSLSGLSIELKEADNNFSSDKYDGLEGLEFEATNDDATRYAVNISSLDVSDINDILNSVKEDSNVENVQIHLNQSTLGYMSINTKADYIRIDGDSNSDNRLNVRDCSTIARMLAEQKSDELPDYSDFNLDGNIDVRDSSMIARYLAEK